MIRAEVERIVASSGFVASARLKRLLRFVVEDTLAENTGDLRGDTIARRFFERGEDFDPSVDNIVRVEMSKLRRALKQWYASGGGGELRIEIPSGTYVPRFVPCGEHPESGPQAIRSGEHPESGPQAIRSGGHPESGPRTIRVLRGPIVAIRPFTSDDSGAFASALSQRLAGLLSRLQYVRVVPAPAREAPDRAYLLEGSVRAIAGTWRVTVSLQEPDGRLVWGETYVRPTGADTNAVEDELVELLFMQLFDYMSGVFHQVEALRARRSGEPARTPYEANIRFPRWFRTFERADYDEVRAAAESVLEAEPDDAPLLATLANLHTVSVWTATADPHAHAIATSLAERAVRSDATVAGPHLALALVQMNAGNGARMREAAERAMAIGTLPGAAAWALAISGAWERGTAMLRRHLALGLRVPGWYHHALFLDAYRRGDLAAALEEARLVATPTIGWDPLDRAAAFGKLGRTEEALSAAAELRALLPGFAADPRGHLARLVPDAALAEALMEGLMVAGFEAKA